MAKKCVDIFAKSGEHLFTYTICVEDEDCHDAEFEEVAMVFAERDGLVDSSELVHVRARCAQ
jgi:hypothetical protein